MPERKDYTVANLRPRRTVLLYGRVLAPKGTGRTSQMDVSEEELLGEPCLRLFRTRRLALVRGVPPATLHAALVGEEPESSPEPAPSHDQAVEPEPAIVEVVATPAVVESGVEDVEHDDVPSILSDTGKVWDEEDLKALSYPDVQAVAKSRGLKTTGKEPTIIKRILAAQAPGEVEP